MVMAPSVASRGSRLRAGIERLARSAPAGQALVRGLADQLRAAVPAEALLLLRTDPTTVLPTDGVAEALPPALCRPFWDNELLEPDLNKFVELARREPPAASLYEATGGDLSRSARYRSMYRALAVSDELRASFAARDGSCWGIAQLLRTGGGIFTADERDLLAAAAPAIAALLRAGFAAQSAHPARPGAAGPALVILDGAGEIDSITPEAREWLAELADGSGTGMTPVPEPVYAVAGRARATRASERSSAEKPLRLASSAEGSDAVGIAAGAGREPACAQVRSARHGWLHLHASCLDTPGRPGDAVAVVITPAHAPDLVPLLALGYRLTQREQEVLRFLARGMTTAELTEQLGISPHTVRDHIKSLFGKVGVRSRAELVARIFAEHYFDQLEANLDRH